MKGLVEVLILEQICPDTAVDLRVPPEGSNGTLTRAKRC